MLVVVVVVVGETGKGGGEGGRTAVLGAKKGGGGRGRVEGVGWGRGGVGGGRGGVGGEGERGGSNRFWGKVCKVCLQTAEFAPSSVNAASCRLGVLHEKQNAGSLARAFFGGCAKGGKKGGFTSDSSNTPLGRRIVA